jgi:hypothetical protein
MPRAARLPWLSLLTFPHSARGSSRRRRSQVRISFSDILSHLLENMDDVNVARQSVSVWSAASNPHSLTILKSTAASHYDYHCDHHHDCFPSALSRTGSRTPWSEHDHGQGTCWRAHGAAPARHFDPHWPARFNRVPEISCQQLFGRFQELSLFVYQQKYI